MKGRERERARERERGGRSTRSFKVSRDGELEDCKPVKGIVGEMAKM